MGSNKERSSDVITCMPLGATERARSGGLDASPNTKHSPYLAWRNQHTGVRGLEPKVRAPCQVTRFPPDYSKKLDQKQVPKPLADATRVKEAWSLFHWHVFGSLVHVGYWPGRPNLPLQPRYEERRHFSLPQSTHSAPQPLSALLHWPQADPCPAPPHDPSQDVLGQAAMDSRLWGLSPERDKTDERHSRGCWLLKLKREYGESLVVLPCHSPTSIRRHTRAEGGKTGRLVLWFRGTCD